MNTFRDQMSYRFLLKLLELIESAEAEFAELGGVLLLLGELLGVPVEDGVQVGGNTSILRFGGAALSKRLEVRELLGPQEILLKLPCSPALI